MTEIIVERPAYSYYYPGSFLYRVISGVVSLIEAILLLRLILQLLNASAGAPFVAWVYSVTDSLVAPFAGALPSLSAGTFAAVFSTILAMIGYYVIGWLLGKLLSFIFSLW